MIIIIDIPSSLLLYVDVMVDRLSHCRLGAESKKLSCQLKYSIGRLHGQSLDLPHSHSARSMSTYESAESNLFLIDGWMDWSNPLYCYCP